MKHHSARGRLAELVDGSLAPAEERAVSAHAAACTSCARTLRQHRRVESLLRSLPASLVPLEASSAAEVRLRALARWSTRTEEGAGWLRSPAFPAAGILAAAAAFAAVLWVTPLAPDHPERTAPSVFHSRVVVAATMPASFLVPSLEAQAAVPYRWRQ